MDPAIGNRLRRRCALGGMGALLALTACGIRPGPQTGPDHPASLAAATLECQVIGSEGGHPRWWGGVVSAIPEDRTATPSPAETQGPLPAAGKVVCRILPGSLQRICDRRAAY